MKLFDNEFWQLWTTLAWVLTRDRDFTERAGPHDFDPRAFNDEYVDYLESDQAWRALLKASLAGLISFFGLPTGWTGNPDQSLLRNGMNWKISREIIRSLEWAWLPAGIPWLQRETRLRLASQYMGYWNVCTSSRELISCFPSESEPIAHRVNPSEPAIHPEGSGYMSLAAAACWIACESGARSFFSRDKEAWTATFAKLLPAIAGGNVDIIGRQNGLGLSDRIDGSKFSSISVDYPYQERPCLDLELGNKARLECSGYYWEDADGWENHTDALWGAGGSRLEYTHLQVKKEDIRRLWPIASRKISAEKKGANDYYLLPAKPPPASQKMVVAAYVALLALYPDRRVPKISVEELASIASIRSRKRGGPLLDRDSVRRALKLRR
jgi:hypothetical protein